MDSNELVVMLAKPRKKGLLRLVFSRFFVIVLLIILQLLLFVSVYLWLEQYMPHYVVGQIIFTIVMILYLFSSGMDASAKLTWMMLIAVFPFVGAVFLLFTQTNFGHRTIRKREAELIDQTKTLIAQDQDVRAALAGDVYGTDDLQTYLSRSGCFPVYGNTEVRYFPQGEAKFAAMLEELEKAEEFIYFEYFIIEEGYMWGRILEILRRKAAAGVDVRVMYDGMCEISNLPSDYPKRLAKLGIRAKAFAPVTPFLSTHYNYRDHRKILVIDGRVAFNGGVNLADEYINRRERFGHWKDTAVMLRGEAVQSFTLLFLQMWNLTEPEPDFSPAERPAPGVDAAGFVMPYGDCPLDGDKVGESVYIDMLYRANTYVHIMTPYLILDDELLTALKYAAQRGIDVKLILPGIPDKPAAYALAKSHYRALTEAGVQIYEYTPGFVHAKVCVSDDVRAVVGTINFDYRSLYHHFECATYLYRVPCIREIAEDFDATLQKCRAVTPETIRNEKLSYKLIGPVLKLVAPLM